MPKQLIRRLWHDQRGEVTYTAVILIYTLLALGAIVGLVCLRNEIIQEFGDLAIAFDQLNQSYSAGASGDCPGYSFSDRPLFGTSFEPGPAGDGEGDPIGEPPVGISLGEPAPPTDPGEPAP